MRTKCFRNILLSKLQNLTHLTQKSYCTSRSTRVFLKTIFFFLIMLIFYRQVYNPLYRFVKAFSVGIGK